MGHLKIRKIIDRETTYIEKGTNKHKHDFCIKGILEEDTLGNLKYYNILKCSLCNSFISVREEGNVKGRIFRDLTEEEKKNILLKAKFNKKNYISSFNELDEVKEVTNE